MFKRWPLLLLPLLLSLSCGDEPTATIDSGLVDARIVDDAHPVDASIDAFNPCPGATTMEFGVVDWETDGNLAGVLIADSNGNMATSAPNGRVVLCIAQSGPITIRFTHDDYVPRVHTTTVEHIADQYETSQAIRFRLMTPATEAILHSEAGVLRSKGVTTVIGMVTEQPGGTDLAGITIAIGADNDGVFTPGTSPTTLDSGADSKDDGRVVFLNTNLSGGTTTFTGISVAQPNAVLCIAPTNVLLEAGVSSISVACIPNP